MEEAIQSLAQTVGAPVDLLRIALCVISAFPLASVVRRVPGAATRDALTAAIGIFFIAGVFRLHTGTLILAGNATVTYILAALWPRSSYMPWVNFLVQMGLLLVTHCHEQLGGEDFINTIGVSGSQMILVQKLTAYAWDRYDGTRGPAQLGDFSRAKRLEKNAPLLRYFAYVFFFPTIMTGPACVYRDYDDWANGFALDAAHKKKRAPSVLALTLLQGLFWVVVYTQCTPLVPDAEVLLQDTGQPFLARVFGMYVAALLCRTKYYAAWLLAEAACVHCGLSYAGMNPTTHREQWDRMCNVRPWRVEAAQNIHGVISNWNIITSQWLRHYVYVRVTPAGKKPGVRSTFATFLVSALWHGTQPGYYLTFVTAALLQTVGKLYRKTLRPVFVDTPFKPAYDVVTLLVTQAALSYTVLPFVLLKLRPALEAWGLVHYYVFVVIGISYLFLQGPLAS